MSEFLARGAMGQILEGQTAIVTGAGSADGIGFAIARRLLRDGPQIAITSTTERIHERARELDASSKNEEAGVADLTEEGGALPIGDMGMNRKGRTDVLVNNAGLAQTARPGEGKTLRESAY